MKNTTPVVLVACAMALCGCSSLFSGRGSIKTPTASVIGVKDAGKPATVDSSDRGETLEIPKGSTVTVTKQEAVPATDKTPYIPPLEKIEFNFSMPTTWKKQESSTKASTGVVDTTVAVKRIEAEESRALLWAALASMVGVGVFLWLKYPTPAYICAGASIIFFLAWKLSGLPDWFWAIGACALVAAGAIWIGHERGESHSNGTN